MRLKYLKGNQENVGKYINETVPKFGFNRSLQGNCE